MLRGKKPEAVVKRLKALFYGKAGVGKTTAAIQFPAPYLIDTEKGAENDKYVEILKSKNGAVFQTSDFEDMLTEVKTLLSVKHDYKTLIIDPLTVVYNDLLEKSAKMLSKDGKDGTEFGRHYNEANKRIKTLLMLLLRLDMNVIITAHSKNEYGSNLSIVGQTYDCYKKLDYLFDLVLRIEKRGIERMAFIEKTRISSFPEGEYFPFNYEEICNRYGREILEKEATPEILASKEEIEEFSRLITLLNVTDEVVDKFLSKSNASQFSEMSSENINKCINFLKSKINNEAA